MNELTHPSTTPALRRIDAPAGWAAVLLETAYPVAERDELAYRAAADKLLRQFECFATFTQEVAVQYARLPADTGVETLQRNGVWLDEIGLGVWPHQPAPTLWTNEEFRNTEPGKLRPLMQKLFHMENEPHAAHGAWRAFLSTGCAMRVATGNPDGFRQRSYDYHRPRMQARVFQPFPRYTSLLEASALRDVSAEELDDWLPFVAGYARESVEDGGLLLIAREMESDWWNELQRRLAADA